jgi:hypothetical protein
MPTQFRRVDVLVAALFNQQDAVPLENQAQMFIEMRRIMDGMVPLQWFERNLGQSDWGKRI